MTAAERRERLIDQNGYWVAAEINALLRDFEAAEKRAARERLHGKWAMRAWRLRKDAESLVHSFRLAAEARARAETKKNAELERLFALQQTRMAEATRIWQKATGRQDVLPDLGDLLAWLMARPAVLEALARELGDVLRRALEELSTYVEASGGHLGILTDVLIRADKVLAGEPGDGGERSYSAAEVQAIWLGAMESQIKSPEIRGRLKAEALRRYVDGIACRILKKKKRESEPWVRQDPPNCERS